MREGIKKKAAAKRRKDKKLGKKDVTWKSRTNKDPGIPASFPYKEQIVMELEAQRREEAALREARKLEREQAAERGEIIAEEEVEQDDNGMGALMESAQQAAREFEESDDEEMDPDLEAVEYTIEVSDDEDGSAIDKSRKAFDKIFKAVVDASDVVLYILDARDPESTRSRKVEEAVLQNPNKRLILVLNKVDLIPENVLQDWLSVLKTSFPTIPLKASSSATNSTTYNKKLTQAATATQLLQALKTYAHKSNFKRSIVAGVIGYPNVGKSSVINALTSKHGGSSRACPVGNQAGVTRTMREIKVDNKLKILDSPGIVFPSSSKKQNKKQLEAQLALLNAIPQKQITDPVPAVTLLISKAAKSDEMSDHFKKFYQLPALPSSDLNEFVKHVLIHVSRKMGRLGKGGVPNLNSAALAILNDWRDGKLLAWTLPKVSKATDEPVEPSKQADQTTIVAEWSKEFDLDGLLGGDDEMKE